MIHDVFVHVGPVVGFKEAFFGFKDTIMVVEQPAMGLLD